MTHVWFALEPEVHAMSLLIVRYLSDSSPMRPGSCWVEANRLPLDAGESLFRLGRARLSTGRIVKSTKNTARTVRGSRTGRADR